MCPFYKIFLQFDEINGNKQLLAFVLFALLTFISHSPYLEGGCSRTPAAGLETQALLLTVSKAH